MPKLPFGGVADRVAPGSLMKASQEVQDVDILTLQDKIARGDYRSDRFPAVPFTSLRGLMQATNSALTSPAGEGPTCPATLQIGSVIHRCGMRADHLAYAQHDWADLMERD